jgi:predicted nucleotidyltransferase component of viral defense system
VITRADLVERVGEWGLTEQVIEKDYVLGWLFWGIGNDPVLGQKWIFKGGTCLKKCYIETYRFSEDLDFTVLPGGPYRADDVAPLLQRVLARVADESGINFSARAPTLRMRPDGLSLEGVAYYVGPRLQTSSPARVKVDLTSNERVVRPPVLREIGHPYPDILPGARRVRCYSFEELFAEKLRAMAERGRPRDMYDIINLFRRNDLRLHPDAIHAALVEKCAVKTICRPLSRRHHEPSTTGRVGSRLVQHAQPSTACPAAARALSERAAGAVRVARRNDRVRRTPTTAVRGR